MRNEILDKLLNELKSIDIKNKIALPPNEKLKKKHLVIQVIIEVLEQAKALNYSLGRRNGSLFVYNGFFWMKIDEEDLKYFLGQAASKFGIHCYDSAYYKFKEELFMQFTSAAYIKAVDTSNVFLINLKNGTAEFEEGNFKMRPFRASDFLTYQLPFDFLPDAVAPLFRKYLDEVLPDLSQQKVLAEYLGYIFISNSRLKLEKVLVLVGSGANGKSVLFDILMALLGFENVSNFSLDSLTAANGNARAMIANKLLNYCPEISTQIDSTKFKQLASGEPIDARLLYNDVFTMTNYAKLMFNTNELPKHTEYTDAYFRRFLLLEFKKVIPENQRDPQLAKKISAAELPGIFNWILEGLKRLLQQKNFTYSEEIEKTLKEYKESSNSVLAFLRDENWTRCNSSCRALKEIYSYYKDYCKNSNYMAYSDSKFAKILRANGYATERKSSGQMIYIKKVLMPEPA